MNLLQGAEGGGGGGGGGTSAALRVAAAVLAAISDDAPAGNPLTVLVILAMAMWAGLCE
jgi:hypothetical protein